MPPVIDNTQNVIAYAQYQPWASLPYASGLAETTLPPWRTQANFNKRLPDAVVATTTALSATYSNGSSGVGATLTASSNGALSLDSYSPLVGDVVLVKDESTASRNGLYVVSDAGSAGTPWVLTRHTAMDSSADFVGYIFVLFGSTNKNRIYLSPPNSITVGTTAVSFQLWPNYWVATQLPEGLECSPATGKITGAARIPGPFSFGLKASADSGATWSPIVTVVGFIDARPAAEHSGVDLDIEVSTQTVSGPNGAPGTAPLLSLKLDDDYLARVRFKKGGEVLDVGSLQSFKIGFKRYESDPLIFIGGGQVGDEKSPPWFGKEGSGDTATYLLFLKVAADALKALLSDEEGDFETYVDLLCEIEWIEENTTGIGEATLRRTTGTFKVRVYRDMIPS